MSDTFPLHLFHELLLAWYKKNKRDLPWRKLEIPLGQDFEGRARGQRRGREKRLRDPYRILVSELMLQQTQVARVAPKFHAFLSKWPTIHDLSKAPLSEVLIMWQGLGYNRRAKHLLETAKLVVHTHKGSFPREAEKLRTLPGFGPYMVSALRVFAFGEDDPVIDVNVERVLQRVVSGELNVEKKSKKEIRELARQSVPKGRADDWHQALMDFGAMICTAKNPLCLTCPLRMMCRANKRTQVEGFMSYA